MKKEWISIDCHVDLVENEVVDLLFEDLTVKTIVYSDFQFILASRLSPLIEEFKMYTHYRKSDTK